MKGSEMSIDVQRFKLIKQNQHEAQREFANRKIKLKHIMMASALPFSWMLPFVPRSC
jgi:hypothetical protein